MKRMIRTSTARRRVQLTASGFATASVVATTTRIAVGRTAVPEATAAARSISGAPISSVGSKARGSAERSTALTVLRRTPSARLVKIRLARGVFLADPRSCVFENEGEADCREHHGEEDDQRDCLGTWAV